jgi:nitroimidazol reductase NimA-like FMN-containing flavoprotein (pyridoxamine 5'-phosphate oxidase superfamily)
MPDYHMTRPELAITAESELREILEHGKYATIALCRENEPYSVPLSYGYDAGRNCLYFHCAAKGLKLDFIRQNPKACVTIVEDRGYISGDCDHAFRSLVIRGEMRLVDDQKVKRQAIAVLFRQLEPDPEYIRRRSVAADGTYDNVGILRLDIREITGKQRPPRP